MGKAIELREGFDAAWFRSQARRSRNSHQARRLLSLAAIVEGKSRKEAAEIGGMDRQSLRDWVHRFNDYGLEGLLDRKSSGAPHLLSEDQKDALIALLNREPDPDKDGVVRWRLIDLCAYAKDTFQVSISPRSMGRMLNQRGYRLGQKNNITRRWAPKETRPRAAKD